MWEYADELFACGTDTSDEAEVKAALELLCQLYDCVEATLIGEEEEDLGSTPGGGEGEEEGEEGEGEGTAPSPSGGSSARDCSSSSSSSSSSVELRERLLLHISSHISALMECVPLSEEEEAHFALWTHGALAPLHLMDPDAGDASGWSSLSEEDEEEVDSVS